MINLITRFVELWYINTNRNYKKTLRINSINNSMNKNLTENFFLFIESLCGSYCFMKCYVLTQKYHEKTFKTLSNYKKMPLTYFVHEKYQLCQ